MGLRPLRTILGCCNLLGRQDRDMLATFQAPVQLFSDPFRDAVPEIASNQSEAFPALQCNFGLQQQHGFARCEEPFELVEDDFPG